MGIEVRDLRFSYGTRRVLNGVGFSANPGDIVAVLGPNGAGKSTMFRCIMGFLDVGRDTVFVDGADIRTLDRRSLAGKLAYIPQTTATLFNHTVLETVLMGFSGRIGFGRAPNAKHRAAALETLESLGIIHLADRGCAEISGGERQLVLLARALVQNARILIMDEPTANLDYGHRHKALERARSLAAKGYVVVMSTHNPEHAFLYANKVLALFAGTVAAEGEPSRVLTKGLLEELYGVGVSLHDIDRNGKKLRICLPSGVGADTAGEAACPNENAGRDEAY
jgi:iron complex transport system ATP-binding protein